MIFCATFPDPPQVKVPENVLLHAGVTINPNQPGLFNKLMENLTAAQTVEQMQVRGTVLTVAIDADRVSVNQLFRVLLATPINEHAQFAIAHVLNIYYRLHDYTSDFNRQLMSSLSKYHNSNATAALEICKTDHFIRRIALQYTQDINSASSCGLFLRMQSRTLIIEKMMSDVSFGRKSLDVQHTLLQGSSSIAEIKVFMMTAPHLPTLMQAPYKRQLDEQLKDYISFISRIETSNHGQLALKRLLSQLKFILVSNLEEYWNMSRSLSA